MGISQRRCLRITPANRWVGVMCLRLHSDQDVHDAWRFSDFIMREILFSQNICHRRFVNAADA